MPVLSMLFVSLINDPLSINDDSKSDAPTCGIMHNHYMMIIMSDACTINVL